MLGNFYFSDKDLFKLNTSQIQDKLMLEKYVNWNNLEPKFKRGTYVKRIKTCRPFTCEELEKLPKNHLALKNKDFVVERNKVSIVKMPIFTKITNKVGVVFMNEEPLTN